MHADAMAAAEVGIRDAEASEGPSPIGLVLQGQKGIGKTHLLGLVRQRVHRAGGYFFLNDITAGDAFWENTVEALRRGLSRPDVSGDAQLTSFLRRACARAGTAPEVTRAITTGKGLTRKHLDAFIVALRSIDQQLVMECGDTARALVLSASANPTTSYIGDYYLGGFDESRGGERRKWGIRSAPKSSLTRAREITRLLASTGPIVIGVDQLDTLIARSVLQTKDLGRASADDLLVAQIADGLMRLREVTRRTVTVLTCLPGTWDQIKHKASDTVPDRFRESLTLGRITDPELARAFVEKRLGVAYKVMGFTPPYPTWPVAPSAFGPGWEENTPRGLLKRIGAHIDLCVRTEQVRELTSFDERESVHPGTPRPAPKADRFTEFDTRFQELRSLADPAVLLDVDSEDQVMPHLLSAALRGWITEVGDDNMEWACENQNDGGELHAWLTRTLDEASDLEEHWAFRVISVKNANSALHRFRKARSAAGLRQGAENRHLIVIRNASWSKGPKTQAELKAFEAAGGKRIKLSEADARTFWALDRMFVNGGAELHEWLVARRPASRSQLLSAVLPAAAAEPRSGGTHPPPDDSAITLGVSTGTGEPVRVHLEDLRKHTAVFAGSGSGKTVLLRRIVEECALRGVSAIVLDPNNDLARLGDPWPTPPEGWGPDDARLAQEYLTETDVVVWTPGRANGRPLSFQPLPDFASVRDDDDEFGTAVEVALATLAPQLRLTGSTAKANIGLAVLRQAVVHYARSEDRRLPGLIALLGNLPDGVTTFNDGRRIAADLAEVLKAAMVNDPLLGGRGDPVDPGVLLTPSRGKRARVSVISFVGLQSDAQRQNFVNQLQMELFAWAKRNPAVDRPLGGLYVMDEAQGFAASGVFGASTRSTIVLASQARKYGLGLLFATQAPKGLHNQVVGNAMTQFFGRLNSPAQIAAAVDLARAKGSSVADISRLERAQFYVSGESFGFRRVRTPLCLTHHPAGPLQLEEVVRRARSG
ncbi:helicase HerA domain-containing protein [Saccharothrix mutabilis subsp. capreolus]